MWWQWAHWPCLGAYAPCLVSLKGLSMNPTTMRLWKGGRWLLSKSGFKLQWRLLSTSGFKFTPVVTFQIRIQIHSDGYFPNQETDSQWWLLSKSGFKLTTSWLWTLWFWWPCLSCLLPGRCGWFPHRGGGEPAWPLPHPWHGEATVPEPKGALRLCPYVWRRWCSLWQRRRVYRCWRQPPLPLWQHRGEVAGEQLHVQNSLMPHSVVIAWVESMSDNFQLTGNTKIKTAGVCVKNKTLNWIQF